MQSRIQKACKGYSYSQGGLNLPDILKLMKDHHPSINVSKLSRQEILDILCKDMSCFDTDKSSNKDESSNKPFVEKRDVCRLGLETEIKKHLELPEDDKQTKQHRDTKPLRIDVFELPEIGKLDYTELMKRIKNACSGSARSKNGLNINDIVNVLKLLHFDEKELNRKSRAELLKLICVDLDKIEFYEKPSTIQPKSSSLDASKLIDEYFVENKVESKNILYEALYKSLLADKELVIPISNLVCANINTDAKLECNDIGKIISNSIIRIASERIFDIPEQSIMELPVNSLDSYNRKFGTGISVGKFGMGFFSIIYWLIGHPNRTLVINSIYEVNGKKQGYNMSIRISPDGLIGKLSEIQTEGPTGTNIRIEMKDDPMDKETLFNMQYHQLERLYDIEGAKIIINGYREIGDLSSKNLINITLERDLIEVSDKAEGIPLQVLISSLLIPSSSTKTIQMATKSDVVIRDKTRLIKYEAHQKLPSQFCINVNNIQIVSITDNKTHGYKYIISMPPQTRLPVARDDIIIEKDSLEGKYLFERLVKLANLCIEEGDLCPFINTFELYVKSSNQTEVYNVYNELLRYINSNKQVLFVPKNKVYDEIKYLLPKNKLVFHPYPDIPSLENQLIKLLRPVIKDKVFKSLGVVFVKNLSEKFTNGGLSQIIFVNQELPDKDPEKWMNSVIMSSKAEIYKYESKFDISKDDADDIHDTIKNIQRINKLSSELGNIKPYELSISQSAELENTLKILCMTFNGIFGRIKDDFFDFLKLLRFITDAVHHRNFDETIDFIKTCINKISEIDLDYSYGSTQIITPILYTDLDENITYPQRIGHNAKTKAYLKNITKIPGYIEAQKNVGKYVVSTWKNKTLGTVYNIALHTRMNLYEYFITDEFEYLDIKFIEYIIRNHINIPELMMYLYICITLLSSEIINIVPPEFILNEIRSRASPTELSSMYSDMLLEFANRKLLITKIYDPIINSCKILNRIKKSASRTKELDIPKPTYIFSAKSLIEYVYNNKIDENWFNSATKHYKQFNPVNSKLQLVEIAVNEGTTKEFTRAVLTELVQNSIDAINTDTDRYSEADIKLLPLNVSKPVHSISINIDRNIRIRDTVGIDKDNSKVLLAMLIPFLSSKSADDPKVTGEMGSGFFNIYRYPWSTKVHIRTVRDNHETFIVATPIIKDERVIDIIYEITQTKTSQVNHTLIEIVLNKKSNEMLAQLLTNSLIYAKNYLVYSGITTYINDIEQEVEKKSVYKTKFGEAFIVNNVKMPSWVMTNNVPFAPISTLSNIHPGMDAFNDVISTGVLINFNKNIYTPVQSRTKINIDKAVRKNIYEFILDAAFMIAVYKYGHAMVEYPDNWINHTTAQGKASQLILPETVNRKGQYSYLYYNMLGTVPIPLSETNEISKFVGAFFPTINMYINYIITKMTLSEYRLPYSPPNDDIVLRTLFIWFRDKSKETITERIRQQTQIAMVKSQKPYIQLQLFVDTYWELLSKCITSKEIQGILRINPVPPKLVVGKLDGNAGEYHNIDHMIIMDMETKHITSELDNAVKENSIELLRVQKHCNNMFSGNLPTPTLIHELFHAVLSTNHSEGGHPSVIYTLKSNKVEHPFDKMASEIYKILIENGLFDIYLAKLLKISKL